MNPLLYPFVAIEALLLGLVVIVVFCMLARVFAWLGGLAALVGFGGMIAAAVGGETEPSWVTVCGVAGLLTFAFSLIALGEFD